MLTEENRVVNKALYQKKKKNRVVNKKINRLILNW